MSGIENITKQILAEAEEQKKQIQEETEREIKNINTQKEKEIETITESIMAKAQKDVAEYEELAKLAAEQKKKQSLLKVKQDLIKDVVSKAYEKLLNLEDKEYFDLLKKLLENAAQSEEGEIIFNKKDNSRVTPETLQEMYKIAEAKGGKLQISEEVRDFDGGFVLVYGGIEENCTFGALINGKQEELADIANAELFI